MFNSLQPHGLQHVRLPYPSPSPGSWSNSCSLSQWCHPTISSSIIPFSSCLQSFPTSGSFLNSQLFASGGQSIGASASTSALLMNIQDWFLLGWTGFISLQSKGLSGVFPNTTVQKHQFFSTQPSLWSYSHIHTWLLEFTLQLKANSWYDITATEPIHVNSFSQLCLCIYVLKGHRSYKLKINTKNEAEPNCLIYAWEYFHSW